MHLPGVLELEANTGLYINKSKWAELPVAYQAMLRVACAYALMEMLAGYDARNPKALNRLVAAVAQLVLLSPDIQRRCAPRSNRCSTRRPRKASSSSACSRTGAPSAPSSTAGS